MCLNPRVMRPKAIFYYCQSAPLSRRSLWKKKAGSEETKITTIGKMEEKEEDICMQDGENSRGHMCAADHQNLNANPIGCRIPAGNDYSRMQAEKTKTGRAVGDRSKARLNTHNTDCTPVRRNNTKHRLTDSAKSLINREFKQIKLLLKIFQLAN